MQLLPDYRARLFDLIAKYESEPFAYGTNDCGLWAGRVVEALTGENLYSGFEGGYTTKLGGFRKMKKATGFSDHISWLESLATEVPVMFAQFGDLAVLEAETGLALVVIAGPVAIGVSDTGLVRVDALSVKRAFRL